ncbi:hypothetical protein GWK47_029632 [Chionoecetes opilio]|uniref:Uncharacterized protein n=1 Tax=Chionoecetes opilio TaxID=41210 RepID=A0A8J5CRF4_CHIOP|nr:hypothetical protein GWK47_029632 [Chionoecetes opilio]
MEVIPSLRPPTQRCEITCTSIKHRCISPISLLLQVLTRSAYQPHDATVLAVYSPLPGSWFAAAYIPDWNEQMQQEGIIHKCRYSLGSIAMWSQKSRVQTLHIGARQSVHTHENLSYYRWVAAEVILGVAEVILDFTFPLHTWFLQVNVSNCHMLERVFNPSTEGAAGQRWCVMSLYLEARSLPLYNPSAGVSNLTQGGGHVFVEKRPFTDAYYYLLVDTEGETSLDITILTKGKLLYYYTTTMYYYTTTILLLY